MKECKVPKRYKNNIGRKLIDESGFYGKKFIIITPKSIPWLPILLHGNGAPINIDKSVFTKSLYDDIVTDFHNNYK